jgi:glycogen phosphorylase
VKLDVAPKLMMPTQELPLDAASLQKSFLNHIQHSQGKHPSAASRLDEFMSIARAARDRMFDRWVRTWQRYSIHQPKRVYYLSMEYLMGRLLEDALVNMGLLEETRKALSELGIELSDPIEQEHDAGLGNGGLGRLAACFLDSMATLGIAGMGYGLRYDYGIFRQDIVSGSQVETPDNWLAFGNPWEVARPERMYEVHFGGRVIQYTSSSGRFVYEWVDTHEVRAMAYDIPVPGFRNGVVNTLRLWSAKATSEFDIHDFNRGDYIKSVERKSNTENITRVLYPNDNQLAGKELRLKQEYFLVSATLQDAISRHLAAHPDLSNLPDQAVFQLNDTHPALAVAELMRLLVDLHEVPWAKAWELTRKCLAYTNHTILPEALERWPVWLMERLLPRHVQIIYDINAQFLAEVRRRFPDDLDRVRRMSLLEEGPEKKVRMAHLAIVGSRCVNGVSALHSQLLRDHVFKDFDELYPGRIVNQTNGVTPRRWLLKCNPGLSSLITEAIGEGWETDLGRLEGLVPFAGDAAFRERWRAIKRANKEKLAQHLARHQGLDLDPTHLLDSQVKRIHEYKRQLLNLLHVVSVYLRLRAEPGRDVVPRTFLFSGKAAPGYDMAKRIVNLINAVGSVINADPVTRQHLRVLFVPNYSVTLAEYIIPASDVSEQISTAGTEASGTGNMKFALNGALTIGTLDGANVEIMEAVGHENMFIFGLTADQAENLRSGAYDPKQIYLSDSELRGVLEAVSGGMFSHEEPARFRPVIDALLAGGDPFLVLADFRSYVSCHAAVEAAYRNQEDWSRRSILNVAHMGRFSSDVTIRGYARDVWALPIG